MLLFNSERSVEEVYAEHKEKLFSHTEKLANFDALEKVKRFELSVPAKKVLFCVSSAVIVFSPIVVFFLRMFVK
jgi:hypothetical protein